MEKTKVKMDTGWNIENSYANLPKRFFTHQQPELVPSPKLVILNHPLAASLGLNSRYLESTDGLAELSGNMVPKGSKPLAQAYAGHQYAHFTMLGDGRALLLGEQITPKGERLDIQLKGSGRTPYSRRGDGKAALKPMLREYIISEAMEALGIPTTRSLAVVTTGETIIREELLPGAILTRIASSHIRVGTFQYASEWCGIEELKALADYSLERHYNNTEDVENKYLFLLKEVIKRQAELIAKWQLVGFIHGVMNTDNMTISGETIDYGPCAFMDAYDPATVFSSIDTEGRYAYGNQPYIAAWNLARFAETLLPLLHDNREKALELAQDAISDFSELYHDNWMKGMRAKLGIFDQNPEDEVLVKDLLNMMHKYKADYTNTFRALTLEKFSDMDISYTNSFGEWHERWQKRINSQEEDKASSHELMKSSNPAVIPRNHRVEEALEAAEKREDYNVMKKLLDALERPYSYSKELDEYAALPEKNNCNYRTFCGT